MAQERENPFTAALPGAGAMSFTVSNIAAGADETVTISVNAPSSAAAFLAPFPGIVDCGGAANVGHGDACTLVVSTDGDYVVPFSLGPDRPPGFTLVANPGGKSVQVGRDARVANPTGVNPALHTVDPMAPMNVDFTVTVDIGPAPGATTLPVRWISADVPDADLDAGRAGTLPRECAPEFRGDLDPDDLECLTDVAAIPASDMPQEVLVPVNFSFPDAAGNRATLVFGRHAVVIEN